MSGSAPLAALRQSMAAMRAPAVLSGAAAVPASPAAGPVASSAATPSISAAAAGVLADVVAAQQMQELARQLAIQMDQNNELLAQLQRLEEDQLAMQKAASDKQSALRQALAVADAARADANEAKRRLAVAQEVSVKLADEVKEARGEAGALARQVEALEAWAGDAKAEIARLADGKAVAEAQVRYVACNCVAKGRLVRKYLPRHPRGMGGYVLHVTRHAVAGQLPLPLLCQSVFSRV